MLGPRPFRLTSRSIPCCLWRVVVRLVIVCSWRLPGRVTIKSSPIAIRTLSGVLNPPYHTGPETIGKHRQTLTLLACQTQRRDGMKTVENGIGQLVRRKKDWRLVTGRGCYVDDLAPAHLAHAVIVRSLHAHARLVSVDTRAAHATPGVLAVLTGADYLADGLGPIPHAAGLMRPPDLEVRPRGLPPTSTDHYPLASDRARFVGEP